MSVHDEMKEENPMDNDEKITALLRFLSLPEEDKCRFTKSEYNENEYLFDEESAFLVCTDKEAEEEFRASVLNIAEEMGLDAFSVGAREHILANCTNEDVFLEIYKESNRFYAEDIKEEENPEIPVTVHAAYRLENELLAFAYMDGLLSDSDFRIEGNIAVYEGSFDAPSYYQAKVEAMESKEEVLEFASALGHYAWCLDILKEKGIPGCKEHFLDALKNLQKEGSDKHLLVVKKDITVTNRLLQECLENSILSGEGLTLGVEIDENGEYYDYDDLVEIYCEYADNPRNFGYDSAAKWFYDNYGQEELLSLCQKTPSAIDWEKVVDYTKETDGRGHILNRWDGQEYEGEVNGKTLYIYPGCDFENWMERKGEERE